MAANPNLLPWFETARITASVCRLRLYGAPPHHEAESVLELSVLILSE